MASDSAGEPLSPPPKRFYGFGWVAIFVGVAVMFSLVWTQFQQMKTRSGSTLKEFGVVPKFELLDQTGANFGNTDLEGFVWVCNFIFTRCPGPCPMMTSRMLELQQALVRTGDSRVKLVTVTVDPAYDTPEILTEYAKKVHANADRWTFLTGAPTAVEEFVVKGMLQPLAEEPDGLPAHSTRFVVVDPNGKIRSFREGENPEVVANLLDDIGSLMREFPATVAKKEANP